MAALKALPSNWKIVILVLEIGFLFVSNSEARRDWSINEAQVGQGSELTLKCPAYYHVVITYAEYGNRYYNCSDVSNQHALAMKCNHEQECFIPVVGEGFISTCPEHVRKSLHVKFACELGPNRLRYYLVKPGENTVNKISCPAYVQLYISEAFYIDDPDTCVIDGREKLQKSCKEHKCTFPNVFDGVDTSTCSGPLKYLLIMYICKVEEHLIAKVRKGKEELIKCPNEYTIDIINTDYSVPSNDCKPNEVDAHIKKRCSSKQTCLFEKTTFSDFPSGCESDQIELMIAYRCVQKKETRKFSVFENGLVDLSCFHEKKIKIIHASYGNRKEKCGSRKAMERLSMECNGKMTCCGTANPRMLGDSTCPEKDIEKIMVTYDCIEDKRMFVKEPIDQCHRIRFKISSSFGEFTSETFKKMDKNLILMIGTSLPNLKKISTESYRGIVEYMKSIPSLEVIPGSSEDRRGSYSSKRKGITDMIKRTKCKYEAISWYNNFIDNANILKDAHIDIEYFATLMAETGVAVSDFGSLFKALLAKVLQEIDIAILRFPDIENPYFLVYNIYLSAWRISDRVLFYEMTEGGLNGRIRTIKFRPNKEYLASLGKDVMDSAIAEAEKLFE